MFQDEVFDPQYHDWRSRLEVIVQTMREMSLQTDPQAMVAAYGKRMRQILPADGSVSLSRRDLPAPQYRITRYSGWKDSVNPWKQKDRLPVFSQGLLGELIYGDEPRIIDDLKLSADDPAGEYLAGQRSLLAMPLFDQGVALNMVVILRREPGAFSPESLPTLVWMSNLFGRATQNLVLSEQLQEAYALIDHEMKVVADIQRSLLARNLPRIPTLDVAAYYETSRQAGGDYYDFLPLPDGKWGILIADVSGHGTPAAVIMAVMHSIVHTYPGPPQPPAEVLTYVNQQMTARYTTTGATFITAFYGIYDPARRELRYTSAGHPPPMIKHCDDGSVETLDNTGGLPLGIFSETVYEEGVQVFRPGDQVLFYTDGITEARNPAGEMFGAGRLDAAICACGVNADSLIRMVLDTVTDFTAGWPAEDDRTLVVGKIS